MKKELEMLAAALIDGCQFSGTKSVEVDTPAQKAAADEELFVLVGNVGRSFFTRCKMLDLVLTRYPKDLNPYTSNIWASGPPIMKRTAKHSFVWVTKGTAESNFKHVLESVEASFGLFSCQVVQANHL